MWLIDWMVQRKKPLGSGAARGLPPSHPVKKKLWWEERPDAMDADIFEAETSRLRKNSSGAPARMLCLHGQGSNNDITALQLAGLEAQGKVMCDVLSGPHVCGPLESAFTSLSESEFYSWWRTDDDLRASLVGVLEFIDAYGPYDGLYGFSQGANLVAALSAPGVAETLGFRRTWNFVVCACGVDIGNAAVARLVRDGEPFENGALALPSFHVIGRKDSCKPMSLALAQCFRHPSIVYHDGGHELPMSLRKDPLFRVSSDGFFRKATSPP